MATTKNIIDADIRETDDGTWEVVIRVPETKKIIVRAHSIRSQDEAVAYINRFAKMRDKQLYILELVTGGPWPETAKYEDG